MVSIIITHHRTPALLKLCLKSIKDNVNFDDFEIIVVDGHSQEETRDFLRNDFAKVKLITFVKNIGYARLVNNGLKQAQGDFIFILNADVLVIKDAFLKMLDFIKNNPKVGMVGPQLIGFDNKKQDSCFRFPTASSILARRTFLKKTNWGKRQLKKFVIKKEGTGFQKVDWLQGSVMLTSKKAVKDVGLMDERFFLYLEDTDWCRRFWQKGYEVVFLPQAEVYHYHGRASKKWGAILDAIFNKYARLHLISAVKYFWKWRK